MSTTKHTTIDQLKKLALRTKSEIGLVDAKVAGLTTKVNDLVTPVPVMCTTVMA